MHLCRSPGAFPSKMKVTLILCVFSGSDVGGKWRLLFSLLHPTTENLNRLGDIGYVHTVSFWDWQPHLLTGVSLEMVSKCPVHKAAYSCVWNTVCINVQWESSPYSLPVTIVTVTKVKSNMATSIILKVLSLLTWQESKWAASSSVKSSITYFNKFG